MAKSKKKKVGRKTLLTVAVQGTIVKVIGEGNYMTTAASEAGIDYRTVGTWLAKGEEDAGPVNGQEPTKEWEIYRQFRQAVKKAESTRKRKLVKRIVEDKSWTSALAMLERMYPHEYGRRERVRIETALQADEVMKILQLCDDRVGMEMISTGQNAFAVLLVRMRHLEWPEK